MSSSAAQVQKYRVNPVTHAPEFWCDNCKQYKHITFFDRRDTARDRRICVECKERLYVIEFPSFDDNEMSAGPYGGARLFTRQVWPYLKPAVLATKGVGNHGKLGRPVIKGIRTKTVNRVLSSQPLPEKYVDRLRLAILDPEKRVHDKVRLWLALRPGVLDNRLLRLCSCRLASSMLEDAALDAPHDLYEEYRLKELVDDFEALIRDGSGFSRGKLEAMRDRVRSMGSTLDAWQRRRRFDPEARYVFFSLSALLRGEALTALHTIAFYFVEYFHMKYGSKNAALAQLLNLISGVVGNAGNASNERDKSKVETSVPVNTFWMEYDHFSTTRFLVVTDSYKDKVELRIINNNDTPEEVGKFIYAERYQFENIGPGYFMKLEPEDIKNSGVPVSRINALLSSWGMKEIE